MNLWLKEIHEAKVEAWKYKSIIYFFKLHECAGRIAAGICKMFAEINNEVVFQLWKQKGRT